MGGCFVLKKSILLTLLAVFVVLFAQTTVAQGFAQSQLKNPPMNHHVGQMWERLDPGEIASLNIDDSRIAVTQFNFTSNKNLTTPGVMLYGLVTLPSSLTQLEGIVYQYFKIEFDNMVYWDVNSAKFIFKVSVDWLNKHQSSSKSVYLFKQNGSSWVELPTKLIKQTNSSNYYEASFNSSKYLAIAVKGAYSNKEAFTTVGDGTLFLKQTGSDKVLIVDKQKGVISSLNKTFQSKNLSGNNSFSNNDRTVSVTKQNKSYANLNSLLTNSTGSKNKTKVSLSTSNSSILSLLFILLGIIFVILIYRWKTRPTIEEKVLNQIKKHK